MIEFANDPPPPGPESERRLRESMARIDAKSSESGATPSPESLHDALTGRLSEPERLRVVDQALATAAGRRDLATLHTALGAAREAWPDAGASRRAWWAHPGIAVAATALIAIGVAGGVWQRARSSSDDPFRAIGTEATAAVTLVAPAQDVAAGTSPTLVWRAVPGAARYELEALGPDGTVRHSATTRDTTLLLPASAAPAAGATVEWWVRARMSDGTTRRSTMGRLLGR